MAFRSGSVQARGSQGPETGLELCYDADARPISDSFLVSVCMKYCCDMIFVYCSAKEGGVV